MKFPSVSGVRFPCHVEVPGAVISGGGGGVGDWGSRGSVVDTEFREGAVGRTRSCANAGKKVKTLGSLQYVELMTARRVLFGHNEK